MSDMTEDSQENWEDERDKAAPPAPTAPRRRHGLRKFLLRLMAAGVVAGLLFYGGWFSHGRFQGSSTSVSPDQPDKLSAALFPAGGVELDVHWGDVPARLVQEGVIDLEKLKVAAQSAGMPLTPDQVKVLTDGSDEPIRIDASNAYFALDVLWAVGLASKNAVLTQGPIAQGGLAQAANYASTAGWTIGAKPGPQYLAALDLVPLTPEQQAVVEEVASNSWRPCCGNMTAFPDCNHGMAALGLAELMASQGASADDIFLALKKISPFWFPTQYQYLAQYFQGQGQAWEHVDARLLMGKGYSSSSGFKQVYAQLQQQGALGAGSQGGGKASGCAS